MSNIFAIAFLYSGDAVLLERRHNVSFGDGMYCMVGGKVEQGETARIGVQREVHEETGLHIPLELFTLVHTFHCKGTETEFVALVFSADISQLPEPRIMEPEKHSDMRLVQLNALPDDILPAHLQAIRCIQKGIRYSEHGW